MFCQQIVAALVVLVMLAVVAPARAQSKATAATGVAKEGTFLAVHGLLDTAVRGSQLDGTHFFSDGDQLLLLPYVHQGNGLGVAIGFRGQRGAFEAGYERSRHRGSFLGVPGDATFNAINLDGKVSFAARHRVQPYGVLGLALTWLTVDDGAVSRSSTGNASFSGPAINTGAGVSVFLNHRVAVEIGYAYRVLWFTRASGVNGGPEDLDEYIGGRMGHVVVGTIVIF